MMSLTTSLLVVNFEPDDDIILLVVYVDQRAAQALRCDLI